MNKVQCFSIKLYNYFAYFVYYNKKNIFIIINKQIFLILVPLTINKLN